MKRNINIIIFSTIVLILFCGMVLSQKNFSVTEFYKKKEILNGKTYISYTESNWEQLLKKPKDNQGIAEVINYKLDSDGDLNNSIKSELNSSFQNERSMQNCYIFFKVTSLGNIVAVKYLFENDSEIKIENLKSLAIKIKEKIKLNISFKNTVIEHGYLMLSFKIPDLISK